MASNGPVIIVKPADPLLLKKYQKSKIKVSKKKIKHHKRKMTEKRATYITQHNIARELSWIMKED